MFEGKRQGEMSVLRRTIPVLRCTGEKPGVDCRDDWKHERSVIRREDDVDGRASVTKDEE